MNYDERAMWAGNTTLLARVLMAIVRAAIDVTNEDPNADNHNARIILANNVLRSPEAYARLIVYGILNNANVGTGTSDPIQNNDDGDGALQYVTNQLWDSYAGAV